MSFKKTYSPIFNEEIKPKIDKLFDETYKSLFYNEFYEKYKEEKKNLLQIVDEYEQSKNDKLISFIECFALPISSILIIPLYWVLKKQKKCINDRDLYLQKVKQQERKVLELQKEIVNEFNDDNFLEKFFQALKYEPMGPIDQTLFDEIEGLSELVKDDARTNPYKTSWGVFNKNKIVINIHSQVHSTKFKEFLYKSKEWVNSGNNNFDDRKLPESLIPYHYIDYVERSYVFMQSCSKLKFNYEEPKNNLKAKLNKNSDYVDLENESFEKISDWNTNDNILIKNDFYST